jgi:hypothetical protein
MEFSFSFSAFYLLKDKATSTLWSGALLERPQVV